MVRYSQITKCRKIYGTPGNRKAATGTKKKLGTAISSWRVCFTFFRSSFVVYDRKYLENNTNEKQSECVFPIFEVHITLGSKSEVSAFIGYRNGTFGNLLVVQTEYGSHPFSLLVGDFNSDKKLDFAVANSGTDSLYIFLQTC